VPPTVITADLATTKITRASRLGPITREVDAYYEQLSLINKSSSRANGFTGMDEPYKRCRRRREETAWTAIEQEAEHFYRHIDNVMPGPQ